MTTTQRRLTGRERRTDDRYVVSRAATIRAYRMPTLAARVIDISAGGTMMMAEAFELTIGDEVLMALGSLEIVSTVAWIRENFFGLSFHRRLSDRQVEAILKAA